MSRFVTGQFEEQEVLRITQAYRAKYLCCGRGYLVKNWNPLIAIEDYNIYEIPNWKTEMSKRSGIVDNIRKYRRQLMCKIEQTNIKSNAASICQYLKLTQNERAITSLPFHYTYGLSVIHSHLLCGGIAIINGQNILHKKEFWQFAESKRCDFICRSSFNYEMMNRFCLLENCQNRSKYWHKRRGRLETRTSRKDSTTGDTTENTSYIMYGQTEATARISYLSTLFSPEKK